MQSAFSDYYNITTSHILVSLRFVLDTTKEASLSSSPPSVLLLMSSLAFSHSIAPIRNSISLLQLLLLILTDTRQFLVSQVLHSHRIPMYLNSIASIQIASLSSSALQTSENCSVLLVHLDLSLPTLL